MIGVPSIDMLVVSQDDMAMTLHRRGPGGVWLEEIIASPNERIALPDLGDIGTLAAAYRSVRFS